MMRKVLSEIGILTAYTTSVVAYEGENYHMMEGWHGTTWGGGLFMLLLWVLVVLAIIYLAQKILQNSGSGEEQ